MDQAVGAFEAKTHLSALLERVERGEAFVITRHGRPVARLAPADHGTAPVADVLSRVKALRTGHRLGRSVAALRDSANR
ncbi:MAG: hypothetical protein JWP52_677 [Rhizobacter sp.]|nr:hypothetical protein [Rhizobacter sp.]